ncbi:hypothetical protein C8R32_10939 [Nitrosospira sp. Nsp5]|uniref:Uncharacterized protein n=1 Tax=Nitrosospira multiformis TaxID=1231 RepID=A0ABY0TN29_9PROT|nr:MULTISPECIES: hypothetical protein [Nitrosospira]PTR06755.1 hypothetical protein C8R32_10939 [Nitrosospira sp. Nsp5]SDQ87431.1 hypothetical protein SAMN05216402_2638 [Nitrosospira multiformis]
MASSHTWHFFRAGGFDQVQIDSGADLLALKELDQKLWVALSCPTRGIEFDNKTLDLIDHDADAHVHANEILSAIGWAGGLLKNADLLVKGSDSVALADIDDSSEEGQQVLVSAQYILKCLDKADATEISLADMADIEKFVAGLEFNGDGVIHTGQIADAGLRKTVEDIIKYRGSVADLSGNPGINQEISDAFFAEVTAYADWQASANGDADIRFLGEKTQAAADAFHAIRDKVSDYFTRCQLAAYDARAAVPLSRSAEDYQNIAAQTLSAQNTDIANFPLATVDPDKPLPLISGVNPAWQKQVDALYEQAIVPLFGRKDSLFAAEWVALCVKFTAFDAWQSAKPACSAEELGGERLREIFVSKHKQAIDNLIGQDKAVETEVKAIRSVEKLLRYNRDLFNLVNNFVSFRSFYTGRDKAIFQLGTLYLDGRSCDLCIRVEDIGKHAEFANMSGLYLAYCDCVRNGGAEKISIAAAFTAGDSDFLMVGRNGIFYDRKGQDWDATIVRILDHPISIRQAFWSPYKKLSKFISEQLQKMASSRAAAADEKLIKAAVETGTPVAAGTPPPPPKPPFDVGKFAGIFAAIGLALGAIGGILASVVGGILGLKFWQIPLAIFGLMLLISGPAMIVAWFKLKKRNLGPVLDANGWAINARARINIPFGTSLTKLAHLPQGARRSLTDPFEEKKPVWPYYMLIVGIIVALIGLWFMGIFGTAPIQ